MSKIVRVFLGFLFVSILLVVAGCPGRKTSVVQDRDELIAGTVDGDFDATVKAAEAAWEKRMDRAQLEEAIRLWEEAITIRTPDLSDQERVNRLYEVYVMLTRAYYFLADTHIRLQEGDEDIIAEEMKGYFELGVDAAEKGITIYSPEFRKKILYGETVGPASQVVDAGGMEVLYWYSVNMGKWALLEGFDEILARKDDIFMIMSRVEELTPELFYGAVGRYFGVFYTKLPFPGGDLPTSKQYFEWSISVAPDYFATRVLYAQNYAVKMQDKELYREQLELVLNSPADGIPELEPENLMEQKKAKRALDNIDDFFAD